MSTFPPPPLSTIDWDNLTFSVTETYGHVECTYTAASREWSPPKFVTDPYLRVHGMSPGLNYGLQCFEGLRASRTPENRIAIFRPWKNAARMEQSAAFLGIPVVPESLFMRAVHEAVSANAVFVPPYTSSAALYIRPVVFGSGPQVSLSAPQHFTFCVYVSPTGTYHGSKPQDALILENLDRTAPLGTGHIKVGGNYAPVFRFSADARAEGFQITLHLDSKTRSEIDEFSTSGFIGVKRSQTTSSNLNDKVTLVVPSSSSVLKSVTSESVCEIASSFGWEVQRRAIPYEELVTFDEVIAAGTAAALVSIRSITMHSSGDTFTYKNIGDVKAEGSSPDETELVVEKLLRMLRGIQRGEIEDQFGWLDYVSEPPDLPGLPPKESSSGSKVNGVLPVNGVKVPAQLEGEDGIVVKIESR